MAIPTQRSTPGAEATEVLGTGPFGALRSLVQNEERIIDQLARRAPTTYGSAKENGFGDTRGPYRYNGTPMIITTENLAAQERFIVFWSGPSNTQWSFPTRTAEQQSRSGTVLHAWRDSSRRTFFDEPTVAFTFQAGNIMPVRIGQARPSSRGGTSQKVAFDTISPPPGILDFYDFFEVINQPKILSDGRPNFVFIAYHSLVYPEIFMRGFFTPEGLSFSEDSQNPANLTWTATFKVRSTEPPFWNSSSLYESWMRSFGAEVSEDTEFSNLIDELAVTGGALPARGPSVLGSTGVPIPGQGDGG